MNPGELLFVLAIGLLILALPIVALVLSIIAFVRSRRAVKFIARIEQLELLVDSLQTSHASLMSATVPEDATSVGVMSERRPKEVAGEDSMSAACLSPARPAHDVNAGSSMPSPHGEPVGWETFIGQKAFGWLAVILFTFSAAFFLRYAFQNDWIGPVGRVAIGELAGIALVGAGAWYFRRAMTRLSSMATSAGIVVLYLSTYSAFGLYRLMPQSHTGIFLAVLVFESMLAAVLYRSASIALAAVIGGLLTPVLLTSDHDAYRSLFVYLSALNVATVLATLVWRWKAVSSVCYVGTQCLFWLWYISQYHPEKFAWAFGFQLLIFFTHLGPSVVPKRPLGSPTPLADQGSWEEIARLVANALVGFASFQILIRDEYQQWLAALAISMASLYALVAHMALARKDRDNRMLLASLAVAMGFIAWSLPLQANTGWHAIARWVSMGWAVIGLALWRFGLRVSAPALRAFASAFAIAAVIRLLTRDLPLYVREPFVPIFNDFAFPSLIVAFCLLSAVVSADACRKALSGKERAGVEVAGIIGVALVWLVLSIDCYGYFVSQSILEGDISDWRWRGQLALTVLWTVFATVLLALGFRLDRARLRWLGMSLYGITVIKLFLVDMANVLQLYRILAFFVLAVVLGLVARAYQRFK